MINLLIPLLFLLLPTIFLFVCGQNIKKTNSDKAKIWYFLAAVYLIVGLGICGSLVKI